MTQTAEKKPAPTQVPISPTLLRLIEEVRLETQASVHAYDRIHNRHNR